MRGLVCAIMLCFLLAAPAAADVFLDFDTPGTGSNLDVTPLVTGDGTITLSFGEINSFADPEFTAAGASGNNANIDQPGDIAILSFGYDVAS
ncbi:MAG: hypothetical protein ACYTFD_18920, partial [Planctomycetota bacterium]